MRILSAILIMLAVVGCTQSMYTQGRRLTEQGEYDQAIETLYGELKVHPESARAWRELGVAFYKKGDMIKAQDALMQANGISPDSRANLFIGLIHEHRHEYDQAINAYRAALSLSPNKQTREKLESRLDVLINQKVQAEAATALENEATIKVSEIPENTIAVVDFDNSNLPPDLAPISKGLAEFTAIDLSKIHSLQVVDRLKIDAIMNELALSSSGYADPSTSPRVGRLVGSNRIVTGSVLGTDDGQIRLDGVVVDTRDSAITRTEPSEGDLRDFFKVQKAFVFGIIDDLGITLTPEERDAIQKVPTESYLAFLAYSRGLDYRSRGMYREAQQQFNDAVVEDNSFGQAGTAAKAASAMATAGTESPGGGLSNFESSVTALSEVPASSGAVESFQEAVLQTSGFIQDWQTVDRFGNTVYSPPRIGDFTNNGIIIIRGDLDAEP